jgi:hypothetical protein
MWRAVGFRRRASTTRPFTSTLLVRASCSRWLVEAERPLTLCEEERSGNYHSERLGPWTAAQPIY